MRTALKIFIIALVINCPYAQNSTNSRHYDTLITTAQDKLNILYPSVLLFNSPARKDPDNLDVQLFRSINNSRSNWKDAVLPIVDRSGPPMSLFMPLSAFIYGRASKNHYDENTGYLLGIAEGLNLFTTFGLKYTINRKRPYAALENVYHKEIDRTDPYSFPSGHTSITFTMSILYNLRYPGYPQIYVPMYIYSLIVAYCRPYFGMHYPSDLLGGAIVGAGSAALIFSLRSQLLKFKNNILSENKEDTGSIYGKNGYIFLGSCVISGIIGHFVLQSDKVKLSILPDENIEKMKFNLRVRF